MSTATGKTCVNRRSRKHSVVSLTADPGASFDTANHTVSSVIANYDGGAQGVAWDFDKTLRGNNLAVKVRLKGDPNIHAANTLHLTDGAPLTGTLQITLQTSLPTVPPPDPILIPAVVFVDDSTAPC